jgi:hypothetical protein
MANPSDVIGDWDFTLKPDGFGDFFITAKLSITSVTNGTMAGQITNGPALSNGKCMLGTNTGELLMSCNLSFPGALIFLAGAVTGSKPNCKFDGHYLLISQNAGAAAAAVAFDDPGETGTAGGQQST